MAPKIEFDKEAFFGLSKLIARRFGEDQCMRIAASLSYTCLLSLVPLLAISFAIFAAFPAFDGVQQQLQSYVFQNFVPAAGEAVSEYLQTFTEKTGGMTTIGIVGLGVTAIMLLATIEDALNRIFRVTNKRPVVSRLLMFWALLTLGPLLMGASLSLSTYFYALTAFVDVDAIGGTHVSGFFSFLLPNLMVIAALTFFYIFVPNKTVSWKYGLIGGAVAGIMFAVLKQLFGLYVSHFPSYQAIYGVLATIPIFLIWMYLTWAVVLIGALLTASLQDWRNIKKQENKKLTLADKMAGCLKALHLLKRHHEKGVLLTDAELTHEIGSEVGEKVMQILKESGFVVNSEDGAWVLSRDLAKCDLDELYKVLGLDLSKTDSGLEKAHKVLCEAEQARMIVMKKSLASLVG